MEIKFGYGYGVESFGGGDRSRGYRGKIVMGFIGFFVLGVSVCGIVSYLYIDLLY